MFSIKKCITCLTYKFLSSNVSFVMYMLKVKFSVDNNNIPFTIDHVNHEYFFIQNHHQTHISNFPSNSFKVQSHPPCFLKHCT